MRILMVNYEFPPLGGGGGVAAANLANEFVRKGHCVDYITTHYRGLKRQEEIQGVRIYREPVIGRKDLSTATIVSMLTFPLVAVKRGLSLGRKAKWDVINTHFAIPSGPAGYAIGKIHGIPNILSLHGGDIYDPSKPYSPHRHPVLKQAVKFVLNQACCLVPQSGDTERRTAEIYRPSTQIRRIPLGYVRPAFKPCSREELGLKADVKYAIAVGRLIPRKAYQHLLTGFAEANLANWNILMIGDGPEEAYLRSLASDLGIADRIHFLGYTDEEKKYQYLSAADCYVSSSLHEGFGIVFQEAMYCGLPIIATNVGGQTDFLVERHNALLVKPECPSELAHAFRTLAEDSELLGAMGRANKADIESHFVESIADRYLSLFEEFTS